MFRVPSEPDSAGIQPERNNESCIEVMIKVFKKRGSLAKIYTLFDSKIKPLQFKIIFSYEGNGIYRTS